MSKNLSEKDIKDGQKISEIFAQMSKEGQAMALGYLSALRDKEMVDYEKEYDHN